VFYGNIKILWEHKKSLYNKFDVLSKMHAVNPELQKNFEILVNDSLQIHNMYIKFSLTKNRELLWRIKDKILKISFLENESLLSFYNQL
jgi:hypothetical protein